MKYIDLFEKWGLKNLKLNLKFIEAEFEVVAEDQEAAWAMYVQMITTVMTQKLEPGQGDEQAALNSVYSLFEITREILTAKGRKAQGFSKIAVIILNQIVRPFTTKWHKMSLSGAFQDFVQCTAFRLELELLQSELRKYTALLADLAEVEDITDVSTMSEM